MKKVILFLLLIVIPIPIFALDLNSKAAVAYNINEDKFIFELNKNEKYEISSLSQIAMAIVSIENINNLDEQVTINSNLFNGLSSYPLIGYDNNEKVSYEDLLYGLLLNSGADSALTLAVNVFENNEKAVEKMNELADKLHLTNTHFDNVLGIASPNNYSTLEDLTILLKYALKNETFKKIYTTFQYKSKRTYQSALLKYKNSLKYVLGSKSGSTSTYNCLSTLATDGTSNYIVITVNDKDEDLIIKDTSSIYDYVFNNFSYKTIIEENDVLATIDVLYSKEKSVNILSNKTHTLYLNNDITKEDLTYTFIPSFEKTFTHFTKDGQIGKYVVSYNNETLLEVPVNFVNDTQIDKMQLLLGYKYIPITLLVLIIIDVLVLIIIKKSKSSMYIETLKVGGLKTNCYILTMEKDCLIVDPGAGYKKIMEKIEGYNLLGILLTHEHIDHIGSVKPIIKSKKCKVFYKPNLSEKTYKVGPFVFDCIFTPGHTKECVTYHFKSSNLMFVGDFIFKGSIGRCDLKESDIKDMKNSLAEIKRYSPKTVLYPGHGPKTTLAEELKNNDFLKGDL